MMNFEKFLPELESLKNARQEKANQIKSHGLPVIIYGAGKAASLATKALLQYGVKIDGYAVDVEYFQPNKIYFGKPVYNFAELLKQSDKYVFVLGMGDEDYGGVRALNFLQNENILKYALVKDFFFMEYEYIVANLKKFAETFAMLSDELSRQTMLAYLKAKITGDPLYNFSVYDPNQYFNALTASARRGGVCGLRCLSR